MKKLNWVSNEKELGTFIQIRNTQENYFITKSKNETEYTLTIINGIRRYFNTIDDAKNYAEIN